VYHQSLPEACQQTAAGLFSAGGKASRIADDETVVACYCAYEQQQPAAAAAATAEQQAAAVAEIISEQNVQTVVLPAGVMPGQSLSFHASDGRGPYSVVVPDGAAAGQTVQIYVPAPAPPVLASVATGAGAGAGEGAAAPPPPLRAGTCYVLTSHGRHGSDELVGKPVYPPLAAEYIELARVAAASASASAPPGMEERRSRTSMWADFAEVYRTHHPIDAEGLRAELSSMKLSAIKKRAVTLGVSADALESADDESDIRAAVISLVVEKSE
jgi:hypothetical protein